MKKSLLIVAVLGLSLASCKKDRVCSCKTVKSYTGVYTGPSASKPADEVIDEDHTIVKVGLIPARRACIHTKESIDAGNGLTLNQDINCSLK